MFLRRDTFRLKKWDFEEPRGRFLALLHVLLRERLYQASFVLCSTIPAARIWLHRGSFFLFDWLTGTIFKFFHLLQFLFCAEHCFAQLHELIVKVHSLLLIRVSVWEIAQCFNRMYMLWRCWKVLLHLEVVYSFSYARYSRRVFLLCPNFNATPLQFWAGSSLNDRGRRSKVYLFFTRSGSGAASINNPHCLLFFIYMWTYWHSI